MARLQAEIQYVWIYFFILFSEKQKDRAHFQIKNSYLYINVNCSDWFNLNMFLYMDHEMSPAWFCVLVWIPWTDFKSLNVWLGWNFKKHWALNPRFLLVTCLIHACLYCLCLFLRLFSENWMLWGVWETFPLNSAWLFHLTMSQSYICEQGETDVC